MTCKDCKYYHTEMDTGYGDYCDLHKFRFEGDIHTCEQFEPNMILRSRTRTSSPRASGGSSGSVSPSGGDSRPRGAGCLIWVVVVLVAAAVLLFVACFGSIGLVRAPESLAHPAFEPILPLTFQMELV